MKIVLITLVCLSACKTYQFADTDFPEPKADRIYLDTLHMMYYDKWNRPMDSLTFEFEDTTITKAFLDSLVNQHRKKVI